MGVRGIGYLAAACALAFAPAASAHRLMSVGYRTPSALRGVHVVERVPALRVAEVRVANQRVADRLRSRPGIRFVQRVVPRVRTGSPAVPFGSVATVPEWQWSAAHEDTVPTWVQQAASRVRIAVVDTGADLDAPSFAGKTVTTWNVTTNSSVVSDSVGHGTFVASLAAGSIASPNGLHGFGGNAQLMVVQANRGNSGFSDVDEANAITWAVDHRANIINLSLGGSQTSQVERSAVSYAISKGVLLVAAAGNDAQDGNPVVYPAALIGRSGLVVGAADTDGSRAAFSTTGSYVDLLAPGVNVLGALAHGTASNGYFLPVSTPGANGAYGYGSGTSYAAPEVAGAAALVMAANPALGASAVTAALEASASGNGIWTNNAAFGDLNVAAAVQQALGGQGPQLVRPAVTGKTKAAKARKNATAKPAGKKKKG